MFAKRAMVASACFCCLIARLCTKKKFFFKCFTKEGDRLWRFLIYGCGKRQIQMKTASSSQSHIVLLRSHFHQTFSERDTCPDAPPKIKSMSIAEGAPSSHFSWQIIKMISELIVPPKKLQPIVLSRSWRMSSPLKKSQRLQQLLYYMPFMLFL